MSAAAALGAAAGALGALALLEAFGPILRKLAVRARRPDRAGTLLGARRRALIMRLSATLAALPLIRRIAPPNDLRSKLVAAGEPGGLGVRDWITIKIVCALLCSLAALSVVSGAPGRLGLLVAACAPAAGFLIPDFWLARAARMRIELASRELPDMLDLLRVTIEGGSSPLRALGAVGARFDGPLAREWRRAAAAAMLGAPQEETFELLARRLPSEEVRAFVESLRSSRRHGVPLGRMLATQATRARHRRRQRVREQAARAGPKIQLVVALLLVPSVLLMVAAALVAELLQPGLGLGF